MKQVFIISFILLLSLFTSPAQSQQIVDATFSGTFTKFQLNLLLQGLALNGIDLYRIRYTTPDAKGVLDTASGLAVIPTKTGFAFPMVLVQHGTVPSKQEVPSNLTGGWELGAVFGARGYAAILPDYIGLGDSRGFHPYLHAATESSAAIDLLLAIQEFADSNGIEFTEQLFITGYSQGGHAAQAVHREIQTNWSDQFTVTAATHMSGPYSISSENKKRMLSDEPYDYLGYIPNTLMGYNEVYQLYDSLSQYMKQPYADISLQFYRGEIDIEELHLALITAANNEFGTYAPRLIIQDSILDAIIEQPDHPINVALRDNDTYDWAPEAPTRLLYCMGDDQVVYTNSLLADSVMNANGAVDGQSIDIDPTADHRECIIPAVTETVFFFDQYANFTVITSTQEEPALQEVRIFPNPVRDRLFIEDLPAGSTIQLFDMQGRRLQSLVSKDYRTEINTARLVPGMYNLLVQTPEGLKTAKVVVR